MECGLSVLDDGQQVMRYCGDGEARITVTGGPYDVKGAECRQRGEFLTANFGTNFSKDETAQGEYVGLLLRGVPASGTKATDVKISGLEVTVAGKRQPLTDATVKASMQAGRLEGSLHGGTEGGPVTIEFRCAAT